jgi:hypothetical protein
MNGSPTAQLQAFAQSVYMMIKNRYYDDINSSDGQIFLAQTVDWVNMLIDELEYEVNADGEPIDWIWVRQLNLITGTDRFVQVLDPAGSGNIVSNFTVVSPEDMSNDSNRLTQDLCTLVNGVVTFSRNFSAAEDKGTVRADVTTFLPRVQIITSPTGVITATNVNIFNVVKPLTLLKLGTVKNSILPDIVQGGLNPSYTQKYNDLLTNAINRSVNSSLSPVADYDDFSGVRGVY